MSSALSSAEAAVRLLQYGPNALRPARPPQFFIVPAGMALAYLAMAECGKRRF